VEWIPTDQSSMLNVASVSLVHATDGSVIKFMFIIYAI